MKDARRGRPRDPEVAERVRRAAAELLFEVGFEGTTVDEVAKRAGVAKATLYRRWASKDELVLEAFESLIDYRVPLPDTGDVTEDLRTVYTSAIDMFSTEQGAGWIRTVAMEAARNPKVAALLVAGMETRIAMARALLDKAVARGQVRPGVDPKLVMELFNGVTVNRALAHQPMPGPAEIDQLVELTVRGIAARPSDGDD
ncbi:TetR family transcriptional regulator [Longispora fulva]|uniref:AcrR family transcriptional regulator n=1 Tax=Longispora fulva TaxID=619741 RepID=A0A8J7GLZ5_9ACTN|nr:TetR/AcrR family transcriptional regulator [Longispora fulva]MBG6140155.1 AcrR family transcriptional regulator [Longispora fulva]GIG57468.1 TetR family transcriptional regulator [Longispora fulva]